MSGRVARPRGASWRREMGGRLTELSADVNQLVEDVSGIKGQMAALDGKVDGLSMVLDTKISEMLSSLQRNAGA